MGVLGSGLTGLGNVPTAGQPPGGSGGSGGVAGRGPDWFGYMAVMFQQLTGLTPKRIGRIVEPNDFTEFSRPMGTSATGQGTVASGTGSGVAYETVQTSAGDILLTGATSGAGFSEWTPGGAGFNPIKDVRGLRWVACYRLAIAKAPAANRQVSAGIFATTQYAGVGYAGAATNWQYVRGATPANITDLGIPINSGGTSYRTLCVGNFDLVHVSANANVDNVDDAGWVDVELLTNLPAGPARMHLWNEGTAAVADIKIDAVCGWVELPGP